MMKTSKRLFVFCLETAGMLTFCNVIAQNKAAAFEVAAIKTGFNDLKDATLKCVWIIDSGTIEELLNNEN